MSKEIQEVVTNKQIQSTPPRSISEISKEKLAASLKVQRDQERQMVRGKFIFHECPGGNMGFPFRKYKGDAMETYNMQDGEVYTVPLAVARHLNTNCAYPTYKYANDEQGRPKMSVGEKVRRCSFQSLDFINL